MPLYAAAGMPLLIVAMFSFYRASPRISRRIEKRLGQLNPNQQKAWDDYAINVATIAVFVFQVLIGMKN